MSVHVTIPLAETQKAELEELARLECISVETLVARLVERQLQDWRQFGDAVRQGVESAEREPLLDHADVMTAARQHLSKARRAS